VAIGFTRVGYKPCLHPLLAVLEEAKLVVGFWLRPGNTACANNIVAFTLDLLGNLPRHIRLRLIRADSGFCQAPWLDLLESQNLRYIVVGKLHRPIQKLCRKETIWQVSPVPGTEVASVWHQEVGWRNPRRLVLVRHRVKEKQRAGGKKLIDVEGYLFQALVTNLPESVPAISVWRDYNPRAGCEGVIKQLGMDFALDKLCLKKFFATEAAMSLAVMAYNLCVLFQKHLGWMDRVTAATLRLLPALADRAVLWAGVGAIGDARALLLHAERVAGDALEGFEVMPRHSLAAVLAHVPGSRSPLQGNHEWHALIELAADAAHAAALPELARRLLESAFEAGLVEDATIAANDAQAEQFWLLRDEIAPAERALGPAMQHDISVPVARMAEFVEAARPQVEARFPGNTAVAFGHLGDGNVHFHVLAPRGAVRGEWEERDGRAISRFVHDLVTEWGGSISAEHGIGQLKRDELARVGDPVQLELMRSVKQALDPHGLLNPGKLVPPGR